MSLQVLLFKFLAAVCPAATHADAPKIVDAIVYVVEQEEEPVFGSREADAIILAHTAWSESNMHLWRTGDHGTAFGAFQLHSLAGKGTPRVQAQAALDHLRRDMKVCPGMPLAAYCSGNCFHGRQLAQYRIRQILRALDRAQAS